ncbi:divergent PAP2 family protein [Candidatus Parcubacteria bacterium]|nr:divergent PAP2 family protein [Candidatus Parcubacteria bacterium]
MLKILIIPFIAGLTAQIFKFAIRSNKLNVSLKNLTAYSGMPSGHSAIVISLTTIVGLELSFTDPLFAICMILALLTIRDAIGIRQYLGQHGKILNILIKDLGNDEVLDQKYPHLLERIGHTPLQVLAGSIIGLIVALTGFYIC